MAGYANQRRDRGGNGRVCKAIKEHFDILEYIQACGYHLEEKKQGEYQCVEHGSLWVTPSENVFVWHSKGKGGSIIDFVMLHEGLSFDETVSKLRLEMTGKTATYSPLKYEKFKKIEKRPFELPQPLKAKYRRVFAYLTKTRCIDHKVVQDMVARKFVYESAKHHNCVFVGYDYDHTAKFGCVRSTGTKKFGIDVAGCKKIGWMVNPNRPAMFITEAPIDAMSIMTLLKAGGKDYNQYTHYAQSGNPPNGMLQYHIENNPNVKTVYLCFDRDDAGEAFVKKAKMELKQAGFQGEIIRKLPMTNDFNEDLQTHTAQIRAARSPVLTQSKQRLVPSQKTFQEDNLCISR